MSLYIDYLSEIESRKKEGLKPKPIEDTDLVVLQHQDRDIQMPSPSR